MNGEKGFTYIAALFMVVVLSVSLMTARKQWRIIMQRERETALLYRGDQIVKGIDSYYHASPGGRPQYPASLEHLLKDDRYPGIKRHLRKIFPDPMTKAGEWGVIRAENERIMGVFSKSADEPLKQGGFSESYKDFENKKQYKDWKFIYDPDKETKQ